MNFIQALHHYHQGEAITRKGEGIMFSKNKYLGETESIAFWDDLLADDWEILDEKLLRED